MTGTRSQLNRLRRRFFRRNYGHFSTGSCLCSYLALNLTRQAKHWGVRYFFRQYSRTMLFSVHLLQNSTESQQLLYSTNAHPPTLIIIFVAKSTMCGRDFYKPGIVKFSEKLRCCYELLIHTLTLSRQMGRFNILLCLMPKCF